MNKVSYMHRFFILIFSLIFPILGFGCDLSVDVPFVVGDFEVFEEMRDMYPDEWPINKVLFVSRPNAVKKCIRQHPEDKDVPEGMIAIKEKNGCLYYHPENEDEIHVFVYVFDKKKPGGRIPAPIYEFRMGPFENRHVIFLP